MNKQSQGGAKVPRLNLFYINSTNQRLQRAALNPSTDTWSAATVLDDANAYITGSIGIGAVEYPLPGAIGVTDEARRACLALPQVLAQGATVAPLRVFCQSADSTRWVDRTASLFRPVNTGPNGHTGCDSFQAVVSGVCVPTTDMVPDLEFRPMRTADGSWVANRGHFVLGFGKRTASYRPTRVCWSRDFNSGSGLRPWDSSGRYLNWWCGYADDEWNDVVPSTSSGPVNGGNEDLLFDATLLGGFGLVSRLYNRTDPRLVFYPHADGVIASEFRSGNDFRVMQDYVACSLTVTCVPGAMDVED